MLLISWLTPSHFVILGLQIVFAIAHSGGAALRPRAEKYIGPRLYRIFFALVSLPLAVILIIYFFGHRYDGLQLWQVQGVPGVREFVWLLSAISFLFLYPATFNLLEVAFEIAKQRTSIIPFKAIIDGRQSIKWQEFLRPAYLGVAIFIALLWWSHPLLLEATSRITW